MPARTLKPCAYPGCAELVCGVTHCEPHRKARHREVNQRRDPHVQSAYDSRWRKESKLFLRAHPMCQCQDCKGNGRPAEVVDHVIPHRGDRALFWSSWNWQPMAKACHDRKTVAEDRGFGNDPVLRGAAFVDGGGR